MDKIIIASGPVIVIDDKVLLNQHGEDNFWKFCGGRVEDFDSDLSQAAKREVKEEMGVDIEIINKEPFLMHIKKGDVDVILIHFLSKIKENQIIKPGEDIREFKWIDLRDLSNYELAPNILPTLKHFGFID